MNSKKTWWYVLVASGGIILVAVLILNTNIAKTKGNELNKESGNEENINLSPSPTNDKISIEEVRQIVKEKYPDYTIENIELENKDGILVYEVDVRDKNGQEKELYVNASNGTIIKEELENIDTSKVKITPQQAEEAVRKKYPDYTITDVDLDDNNGTLVYEVEARDKEGKEYDIHVDVANGKILNIETDEIDASKAKIMLDKAKAIVKKAYPNHTIKDIDLERKNGDLIYEIDTRDKEGKEYDITVDAMTGKILKEEIDEIDDMNDVEDTTNSTAKITPEKAKTIVKKAYPNHTITDIDLDNNAGNLVYEIEIKDKNGKEYDITVDAMNGKILSERQDDIED